MTQHVRKGYRNHPKATWGVVLALVVAAAAVAIPIATGAPDKTFTLTVSPNPVCSSPTDGTASTTVTLTNTARSASLGSAEIYFPPNTVHAVSPPATLRQNSTSTTSGGAKDIVGLGNLGLSPRGGSVAVTVRFKAGAFTAAVTAVVKQSNEFNDSGGGANLFERDPAQASWPTMRLVNCVTVSGRVYQDRNLDYTYTTGTGAFDDSDIPKAWTVKLYAKDVGAASYPSTPFQTTTSASDGSFTFSLVPTGSDYKICVTAAGADASSKWALQSPTGNTDCGPISSGGPASSAAKRLPNLSASASGQDFQVVPVVGPFSASDTSTVGGYTVAAGSNSTKADDFYVQDTWVDAQGRTNFRFSPVTVCTQNCPLGMIYLLETLVADIELSDLGGQQATLQYDDAPPFLDGDLKPMPYCLIDPRQSGGALATTGVLGTNLDLTPATSCIVEASQNVVAGDKVHAEYTVYTSYDGGRQVG